MPELVVFDCDGVLVDSERLSVVVDQRVLGEFGWHLTQDEILHRFVGRSSAYFRAELETFLGRPLDHDWEARFQPWYEEAFARDLEPVPGIRSAVERLEAAGTATCVASNGSHDKIRRNLARTGLLPSFDGRIFSADDVAQGKPAPDLFLHAAERMGYAPESCVVVEDSRSGIAAARAAGMQAYGYAGGLTPSEWLTGERTIVFDDMAALPALLDLA